MTDETLEMEVHKQVEINSTNPKSYEGRLMRLMEKRQVPARFRVSILSACRYMCYSNGLNPKIGINYDDKLKVATLTISLQMIFSTFLDQFIEECGPTAVISICALGELKLRVLIYDDTQVPEPQICDNIIREKVDLSAIRPALRRFRNPNDVELIRDILQAMYFMNTDTQALEIRLEPDIFRDTPQSRPTYALSLTGYSTIHVARLQSIINRFRTHISSFDIMPTFSDIALTGIALETCTEMAVLFRIFYCDASILAEKDEYYLTEVDTDNTEQKRKPRSNSKRKRNKHYTPTKNFKGIVSRISKKFRQTLYKFPLRKNTKQ